MENVFRVAIVEDDPSDRVLLKRNLDRYQQEKGLTLEVREFSDGEDLVTDYAADYDLLLMDIQMTFMDGMQTARRVRQLDGEVVIVFITNAPQYAIEGYKVNAVDYILKPISWFSFCESMNRALASRRSRRREYVTIALKNGRTKLDVDRICYVEVQDHRLIYNTLDGSYSTKGTMNDAEAQLNPARFFRCNRCYLVNLKFVETYQGSDVRVNGDVIQVSRRQRRGFLDALNLYMNGDAG